MNLIGTDRTHYIKYHLDGDISVRYHFIWQNNKNLEHKWIIKDHEESVKSVISEEIAKSLIRDLCKTEPIEIMGKTGKSGKYEKRIIYSDGSCKLIDDSELDLHHNKRLSKKYWKKDNKCLLRDVNGWMYKVSYIDDLVFLSIKDAKNEVKVSESLSYDEATKIANQYISATKLKLYFPALKRIIKVSK